MSLQRFTKETVVRVVFGETPIVTLEDFDITSELGMFANVRQSTNTIHTGAHMHAGEEKRCGQVTSGLVDKSNGL
jgi:hypothetical protein